jgi:hypothetical protein
MGVAVASYDDDDDDDDSGTHDKKVTVETTE